MNSKQLHDILMIWLLRRLDLGDARREIDTTYDDLFENGELDDMSHDEMTLLMLDILDRYELPHPIHNAGDYKIMYRAPF